MAPASAWLKSTISAQGRSAPAASPTSACSGPECFRAATGKHNTNGDSGSSERIVLLAKPLEIAISTSSSQSIPFRPSTFAIFPQKMDEAHRPARESSKSDFDLQPFINPPRVIVPFRFRYLRLLLCRAIR